MRILALNGSPRMEASCTHRLLEPLLAGMEEGGAKTELIHIKKLELQLCLGCFNCWVATPGRCIQDDEMAAAFETYSRADLVVFGTPLYYGSMSGLLKTFLDRLLPRSEPWMIPSPHVPERSGHPVRWPGPKQMVLVSPCGFPERKNFDALVHTFRHIARMHGMEVVGEVLRPFAEPLRTRTLQGLVEGYLKALREAGRQIVSDGQISEATKADLERDLFPGGAQQMRELANAHWRREMDRRGPLSREAKENLA